MTRCKKAGAWLADLRVELRWAAHLLNIVAIAILSSRLPLRRFHNQPANTFIARFPYMWLPMFLVLLAPFGHVLMFRWLREARTD